MNNLSKEVCAWQFFSSKTHFLWENMRFSQKKGIFGKNKHFFENTIVFIEKNTFLVKLYGIEV